MSIIRTDPLRHDVAIVDPAGRPTPQFIRQWMQVRGVDALAGEAAETLSGHVGASIGVHGIANTAHLVLTNDVRLSDQRVPTPHALDSDRHTGTLSPAKIAPGGDSQVLRVAGGVPAWGTLEAGSLSAALMASLRDAAQLTGTLDRARLEAAAVFTDEMNTFTTFQTFTGGTIFQQNTTTRWYPTTDGANVQLRFSDKADGSTVAGIFQAASSASAGNRYVGFTGGTDRDGNRLPISTAVLDAAGATIRVMDVLAGADAGKVAIFGAVAAGAEANRLNLDNRSSTVNTAVALALRAGTLGATTLAEIVGRLPSATNGELLLRTRNAGTLAEAMRLDSAQNARFAAAGIFGDVGAAPAATAILELSSTARAFLPPRMTTTQRDGISLTPPAGLTLFNTTTAKMETWDGAAWQPHW